MNASCGRSLAGVPPRVQCLGVFLGSGLVFSLAAMLLHRQDATFAASWLQFLVGVLLAHALVFLFFIEAVERQTGLLLGHLLAPAGGLWHTAMPAAEVEAVLLTDPLDHAAPQMLPSPLREVTAEPEAAVWRSLPGQAAVAVFGLLSLGLTLTAAVAAFPAARDLADDAVTMPGALAALAFLGCGALAAQRMKTAHGVQAGRVDALREALAAVFGTLDWQAPAATEHLAGRKTVVRKERQEMDGQARLRGVVVTREETMVERTERLARLELLLDGASLPQRVLMALLRQAAGVQGLPQDTRALEPLGIVCTAAGDCEHRGRPLAQQELLRMAMRLAQHLLDQGTTWP